MPPACGDVEGGAPVARGVAPLRPCAESHRRPNTLRVAPLRRLEEEVVAVLSVPRRALDLMHGQRHPCCRVVRIVAFTTCAMMTLWRLSSFGTKKRAQNNP